MLRPDSALARDLAIDFDRHRARAKALRDAALRAAFGRLARALMRILGAARPAAAARAATCTPGVRAPRRRTARDEGTRLADTLSLGSPSAAE